MTITAWLRWDAVERLLPGHAGRVLNIGAGTGSVGSLLVRRYDYVGIEPDPVSYEIARRRIGARGQLLNCGFEDLEPAADFDLVCAFEVLEHLEDDATALGHWLRHLKPGGSLVVSVPKGTARFGPVNTKVGDLRRYEPEDLNRLFAHAGLGQIVVAAYGSPYGNIQEAAQNLILRARPSRAPVAERTAASGRFLQPPASLAPVVRAAALPLQYLQRSFSRREIGTGLVARGEVAS